MKLKWSSLLVLLLALALLSTACSSTAGQAPASSDAQSQTPSVAQANSTPETLAPVAQDPFGKYDTPVKLTSVRSVNNSIVKFKDGEDLSNNIWMKKIKEDLNIEIEYQWVVDDAQYPTRISTMLSSGEIPDFFNYDLSTMYDLQSNGLLQEVGTAFNDYAWDKVKGIYAESGDLITKAATIDGKQYGIPFISGSKEFSNVLYVREDWLKNVGEELPKTIDDVMRIADKFANNDPDKNGKKDTLGLPVNGDTTGGLYWYLGLLNGFGAYPNTWIDDGTGKLVYGSIQPEMKTALGKLNELYKKGVIDPEFVTQTYWSMYETIGAGKFGMVYGPYYASFSPIGTYKTANYDKSGDWIPVALPGSNGPAKVQNGADANSYWMISKNCKNPEAVIKLLNYWYKTFYFTENADVYNSMVTATMDDGYANPVYNYSPIQSFRNYHNLNLNLGAKDIFDSKVKYDNASYLVKNQYDLVKKFYDGDKSQWATERGYKALNDVIKVYKDQDLFKGYYNYSPPDPKFADQYPEYANMYAKEMQCVVKIISGALPLSAYDDFINQWKAAGGDQMTTNVNDWYSKVK